MFDPKPLIFIILLSLGIGVDSGDNAVNKTVIKENAIISPFLTQEYRKEDYLSTEKETVDIEIDVFMEIGFDIRMTQMEAQTEAMQLLSLMGKGTVFTYVVDENNKNVNFSVNDAISGARMINTENLGEYAKFSYKATVERNKVKNNLIKYSVSGKAKSGNLSTAVSSAFTSAIENIFNKEIDEGRASFSEEKTIITGYAIETDKMTCSFENSEYIVERSFDIYFMNNLY